MLKKFVTGMKLNAPYYSQRVDVKDSEWHAHSCLIVCSKIVAEFLGAPKIPADDWIKEGVYIGAYDGKFWKHEGVVRLLRNHGIFAYPQEFKTVNVDIKNGEMGAGKKESLFLEKGIEKIAEKIDEKIPTIISIPKFFTENGTHHGVVIIGYEKDADSSIKGFYYHDPEIDGNKGGKDLFVDIEKFKKGWKRLAIFAEK